MAEINDRLEEALAAYLDHAEMGGPQPDVSHLSPSEKQELEELVRILDLTGGVALGLGREEEGAEQTPAPDDRAETHRRFRLFRAGRQCAGAASRGPGPRGPHHT